MMCERRHDMCLSRFSLRTTGRGTQIGFKDVGGAHGLILGPLKQGTPSSWFGFGVFGYMAVGLNGYHIQEAVASWAGGAAVGPQMVYEAPICCTRPMQANLRTSRGKHPLVRNEETKPDAHTHTHTRTTKRNETRNSWPRARQQQQHQQQRWWQQQQQRRRRRRQRNETAAAAAAAAGKLMDRALKPTGGRFLPRN